MIAGSLKSAENSDFRNNWERGWPGLGRPASLNDYGGDGDGDDNGEGDGDGDGDGDDDGDDDNGKGEI